MHISIMLSAYIMLYIVSQTNQFISNILLFLRTP